MFIARAYLAQVRKVRATRDGRALLEEGDVERPVRRLLGLVDDVADGEHVGTLLTSHKHRQRQCIRLGSLVCLRTTQTSLRRDREETLS